MVELSRASYQKMWQNRVWAIDTMVLGSPSPRRSLAFTGFALSPAAGAVLMSPFTLAVALNVQLLQRPDLNPVKGAQCVTGASRALMIGGHLWRR